MGESLAQNVIYRNVYTFVVDALGPGYAWLAYAVAALAIILLVTNALLGMGTVWTWAERRLLGRFQSRLGPNRAGPFGVFQPIADAIKLLTKEDIIPRAADRLVFTLAPVVMLAPTLLVLAVIPFGRGSFLADLNIGLLYLTAVSGIASVAVLMAGYASSNRFATLGAMRAAAMLLSYEVPLVMALLGVALLAGSLSLVDVVESQSIPFLLVSPLGVLVFLVAISAELNRNPFDLTEAESEIVAGYMTEYSGMKYGIFMLAEFTNTLVAGAIFAVLFLQGYRWPLLPSHVWFLLKVGLFAFAAVWVRATLPRYRVDQVLTLAWKGLFPLSLLNVVLLAVEVVIFPKPGAGQLALMGAINWPLSAVALGVVARAVSLRSPRAPLAARVRREVA